MIQILPYHLYRFGKLQTSKKQRNRNGIAVFYIPGETGIAADSALIYHGLT